MPGLTGEYRGDAWLAGRLEKLGSSRTLLEVYGLLHGCLAAPGVVMPSRIIELILGEDSEPFDSKKEIEEFYGCIMHLWNIVSRWNPETEPFLCPDIRYPETRSGLKDRALQHASFITCFLKGLDLGETDESHSPEDALFALETLAQSQAFFEEYARLAEADKSDNHLQKSFGMIGKLEDVVGDCIARIKIGLNPARMREAEGMRKHASMKNAANQVRSNTIGRNDPCPCVSGLKNKKCCGAIH